MQKSWKNSKKNYIPFTQIHQLFTFCPISFTHFWEEYHFRDNILFLLLTWGGTRFLLVRWSSFCNEVTCRKMCWARVNILLLSLVLLSSFRIHRCFLIPSFLVFLYLLISVCTHNSSFFSVGCHLYLCLDCPRFGQASLFQTGSCGCLFVCFDCSCLSEFELPWQNLIDWVA